MSAKKPSTIGLLFYGACFACGVSVTAGMINSGEPTSSILLACGATAFAGISVVENLHGRLSPQAKLKVKSSARLGGGVFYSAVALGCGAAAVATFATPAAIVFGVAGGISAVGAVSSFTLAKLYKDKSTIK